MPVTESLGSLSYSRAISGIDYEYWYLQSTNNIPFYDIDFDNASNMYVLSNTPSSVVMYRFKEYNDYPYTIINGSGYVHRSLGPGGTYVSDNVNPKRIRYNGFLDKIFQVGYERNRQQTVFPYNFTWPATATEYPTDLVLPTVPTTFVYARYGAIGSGSTAAQYSDVDCSDSNGITYVTGYVDISGTLSQAFIKKYDSGLTTTIPPTDPYSQFAQSNNGGVISNLDWSSSVKILSTSVVTGHNFSSSLSAREVLITNFNPAPVLSGSNYYMATNWQRKLTSTLYLEIVKLDKDISDNIYVTLKDTNSNISYVVKYNSSGAIQWQRRIVNVTLSDIVVETGGDFYIIGTNTSNNLFVAKYNASGAIQWQNKVTGLTFTTQSIKIDSGNLYLCGTASSNGFVMKVPPSGSIPGDGTYNLVAGGTIVYSVATQTEAIGTLTDAAGSSSVFAGNESLRDMVPQASNNPGTFPATNLE